MVCLPVVARLHGLLHSITHLADFSLFVDVDAAELVELILQENCLFRQILLLKLAKSLPHI